MDLIDRHQPLVSVVTPVYNGAKYLRECVESVLRQTYENWEYIIVNNASTDETLPIANEYALKDSRIRIHSNTAVLPMMQNWNLSLRQISSQSKYCKIIHADDWLMPECIAQMVAVAEDYPRVAIVGAYRLEENRVTMNGLPYSTRAVAGGQICRAALQGELYVFGSPSNLLLRSDAIRRRPEFYGSEGLHADTETCYELLRESDFGFVHQVLTFTRRHNEAATAFSRRVNSHLAGTVACLVKYGPIFLENEEYQQRFRQLMSEYYRFLAKSLFQHKGKDFWLYHATELSKLGYPIKRFRLAREWLWLAAEKMVHPIAIARGLLSRAKKVIYSNA